MESKDALGDRLKAQEQAEAGRRVDKNKPLMARLDGRAFHTFTKGLARPYDKRMSDLMIATTCYLVEETHAKLGYTQSDEISLYWVNENLESTYMFDGKYQKLTSILAGMASAFFTKNLDHYLPEKANKFGIFDARVWNVNSLEDIHDNFVWRQDDCVKNSISMAAQAHFSPKKLHGVGSQAKKKMLAEIGVPWEIMPDFFKYGSFVKRQTTEVMMDEESYLAIPEQHRPPSARIKRTKVVTMDYGYIKEKKEIFE